MRLSRKALSVAVACMALTAVMGVAGTSAYLSDSEGLLHNVFATGQLNVELSETNTGLDADGDPRTNTYPLTTDGHLASTVNKDPKVTVKAESASCWLFVQIEEGPAFRDILSYQMADGWNPLEDREGIWFRDVESSEADQVFSVFQDDQLRVQDGVSFQLLEEALPEASISVSACAVQKSGVESAAEAWQIALG